LQYFDHMQPNQQDKEPLLAVNPQRYSSIYQENDQLIRAIRLYAKRNVSSKRYQHIKGVVKTAKKLAKRFLVPLDGCAIAAWAHDIAREWDPALFGTYLEIRGYAPHEDEIANPIFLHGRTAAIILKERFGVVDSEILSAVTHHTLGNEELGDLGKVLYIADYMEPGRKYITKEFFESLLTQPTLNHLIQTIYQELSAKEKDFHPQTIAFFKACRLE
jgi:predicted HD superfamily hydrolase involved in NAD metabolism